MNYEPMIQARLKAFRDSFEIDNSVPEGTAFERFVNHSILSSHQPDAFGADDELLDFVCVGGSNDTGIDGIGITINGLLVKSIQEIRDISDKFKRISVELIFIQAKTGRHFKSDDFAQFSLGIRDFLNENHTQPQNNKIKSYLELKDFLLSDNLVGIWDDNPSVIVYYVALGKWRDNQHISSHEITLKSDILKLNTFSDCQVRFIDAEALKTIYDNNANTFSATIETIETMPLTEVHGVNNSCVALCYANEFVNLLSTEEGMIRKSLFDDNVRDYQGTNSINDEIANTIKKEPYKFGLLNNGIAIVCDEFVPAHRRLTLKNPQIVNGCQTSHVIYYANKAGLPVDKVPLHLKIIATNDLEITNQIVRSTNRQNIVYDEAFETTRPFHKDLEDFFVSIGSTYESIYYERRSKQYQHDPRIKQTDKVNLRILTQYFVAIFLNQPHMAHRHESKLLHEFEAKIFQEHQSKLPYYTAAILFIKMERLFRADILNKKELYSFRPHILMLFREMVGGTVPDINNEKKIDQYCEQILKRIMEPRALRENIDKTIKIFKDSTLYWTNKLGKSADGRKDIKDFTLLLLDKCNTEGKKYPNDHKEGMLSFGSVVKVITDKNLQKCGFIRTNNDDLFFHSSQNKYLSFDGLEGQRVSYIATSNPINGRPMATDVRKV